MKKTLTTLIGTIALISSAAFAQTTGQSGTTGSVPGSSSAPSSRQDSTGSGTMDNASQPGQSQPSGAAPQGFSSLDKDSSGEISRREAASQQSLAKIFDRADENKDGQLSQSEYQEAVSQDSSSVQ